MMRKEYDFEKMKGRKNPYAKHLKKQVTIRMGVDIIDYFKGLAEETGVPYQNLINLYLRDCVQSKRKPSLKWTPFINSENVSRIPESVKRNMKDAGISK